MRRTSLISQLFPVAGLLVAIALLALGGALVRQRVSASASTQGQRHATLRWANEATADLATLDPAEGPDFNAQQAVRLIYSGLVRFGPGFSIRPDLATDWSIDRARTTYTFHLRQNARFASGRRVTSTDVVDSLNRALLPAFSSNAEEFLGNIVGAGMVMSSRRSTAPGIVAVDAHTVRITLVQPDGSFLAKLANPCADVVPRELVNSGNPHWQDRAYGSGPFQVARWIHNNALLLKPNPHFYGGLIHISGIDMPFIPEPVAAYKLYRSGGLDTMGEVRFPESSLFEARRRPGFSTSTRLETVYLTLNQRRAPFNQARVRLAFAHALNKDVLISRAFGDFAHPTDGMMPPGLPGYNSHLHGANYDPALARSLLAQAGFPQGRGFPVIDFPVDQDAQSAVLASALASQWHAMLGVRVRLVRYSHVAYLQRLTNLKFQVAPIDWTADFPDPENFLSQLLHTGSPNNNGGWTDHRFDALVDRADRLTGHGPQRMRLYQQAEQIAMQDAAAIPLANPDAGILVRPGVHGLVVRNGYLFVPNWSRVTVPVEGR